MRPYSGAATAIFVAFVLLIFRIARPSANLERRNPMVITRSAGAREPFLRLAETSAVRRYLRVPRTPDHRLSFRTEGTIQLEVGLGAGFGGEPFEDESPRSRADLPLQPRVARQH